MLAFVATAVQPAGTDWWLVAIAAAVASLIAVGALLGRWDHWPSWTYVLPPLAVFVVIALLREAHGGSSSGYGVLAILPVVWVALTLDRLMVVVCAAASTAMFLIPIVILGDPKYPLSGLRGAGLWSAVSLLVGLVVSDVVQEQRRQAAAAARRTQELRDTQEALMAVARVAREIAAGNDARALICATALDVTSATMATIVEPTVDGRFEITGSAGVPIEKDELRERVRPSASLRAFFARSREFIADVHAKPGVSPLVAQATDLASILYEPIVLRGKPVGVLCMGWAQPRSGLDSRTSALASFLAAEAGAAIERGDLVTRLDRLARTDQLTQLPNRRAWDEELERALATAKHPICIALMDLDHFKSFNDRHGHAAGDRLLTVAAESWRAELRTNDLLARHGGEEFAVLLPDCTQEHAVTVLERLRAATPEITCSIGLAQHADTESASELTRRADTALYSAKHNGRNQLTAA